MTPYRFPKHTATLPADGRRSGGEGDVFRACRPGARLGRYAAPAGMTQWGVRFARLPCVFNTGSWNQGFVVQGRRAFLLVALEKLNLQVGAQYLDRFIDPERFSWHSRSRTTRASKHGAIISQTTPGYAIHLFVRGNKIRGAKGAPFVYCGDVDFESREGRGLGEGSVSAAYFLKEFRGGAAPSSNLLPREEAGEKAIRPTSFSTWRPWAGRLF